MGYQFVHIEGYARCGAKTKDGGTRKSIKEIVDEADRVPGNIPHIENPQPPKLIYGCKPTELVQMAEDWANQSTDAKGRKFRKDGLIMIGGVVSLPKEQEKDFSKFVQSTVKWLKKKYGDRLKSVVTHTDETHPHIHFYVLPKVGERFEDIHQGFKATCTAKVSGKLKGEQNQAYKAAMREFQDEFNREVAMGLGLTRIGPGRRRLSRSAWVAEQKQAKFLADSKMIAEKGYRDGFKKGKAKAEEENQDIGFKVGGFVAGLLGGLHTPTAEAIKLKEHAEKKAEAEKKKREELSAKVKKETDERITKIAHELQKTKKLNEDLSKEIENLDGQLEKSTEIIKHYEKKYGVKTKSSNKNDLR